MRYLNYGGKKLKRNDMNIPERIIAFDKVRKVIKSCIDHRQLSHADNMIDNFKTMYGSDNVWSRALDTEWFTQLYLI